MKGKWEMLDIGAGDKEITIHAEEEGTIKIDYDDVDREEALEIARLVTAAPDLLEACKAMVAWADERNIFEGSAHATRIFQLRAAISTAEATK